MDDVKLCSHCKIEKPLSAFGKNKATPDGYARWCKSCKNKDMMERAESIRSSDPDYVLEQEMAKAGKRYCSSCKQYKDFNEFHKAKHGKYGLNHICKECNNKRSHEFKMQRKIDREIVQDGEKICIDCGESKHVSQFSPNVRCVGGRINICKDCNNKRYAAFREEHRHHLKDYHQQYYEDNKGEFLEQCKQYRLSPQGRIVKHRSEHRRRSKKIEVGPATLTLEQWQLCLYEVNYTCPMCKREFAGDILPVKDHIYPLSKGGEFTYWNVQPLCNVCNARKGTSIRVDHQLRKAQTIANRLYALLM